MYPRNAYIHEITLKFYRGEIGLATEDGQPVILGEGIHVRNQRLFKFTEFKNVNQQVYHTPENTPTDFFYSI